MPHPPPPESGPPREVLRARAAQCRLYLVRARGAVLAEVERVAELPPPTYALVQDGLFAALRAIVSAQQQLEALEQCAGAHGPVTPLAKAVEHLELRAAASRPEPLFLGEDR